MAERIGCSRTRAAGRSARGLKPHLVKTFKLSNDSRIEDKLIDVIGLYLHRRAIDRVVMDEKSSVQALDRTQPSLRMVKGRAATITHDYSGTGPPPCSRHWTC